MGLVDLVKVKTFSSFIPFFRKIFFKVSLNDFSIKFIRKHIIFGHNIVFGNWMGFQHNLNRKIIGYGYRYVNFGLFVDPEGPGVMVVFGKVDEEVFE